MPSHYRGSQAEVSALSAMINLMRASDALAASIHQDLLAKRLTISQFGALEALWHLGPLFQGTLAGKLLRSCGSVTAVVAGLEKRGLARRDRPETDGRYVRVSLTPAGRRLIGGLFPRHAREIARRFAALTPSEQQTLRRLCRKLGRSISSPTKEAP